jgi:hypothetical protein
MAIRLSIEDRLIRFLINDSGCWEFTGALDTMGYGLMKIESKLMKAHRVSYEFATKTAIPHGMCVIHDCDNRRCINPDHLRLGTHQENMTDMVDKGRSRNRYSPWETLRGN